MSKLPFKKILINGCSFVAGDEIVWNNFCKEVLQKNLPWETRSISDNYIEYVAYRKKYNLGAQIGQLLITPVIDLSLDGNSNTRIALHTIKTIKEMPLDELKDLHVCIGWTGYSRRLKWINDQHRFQSIHHSHYNESMFLGLRSYIEEEIIKNSNYDHILSFIRDVMLLENFLIRHGITYTFWLSLSGPPLDLNDLDENLKKVVNIYTVSDSKNWLSFNKNNEIPMLGETWVNWIDSLSDGWISKTNKHPSLPSISKMALEITKHVTSRFLN